VFQQGAHGCGGDEGEAIAQQDGLQEFWCHRLDIAHGDTIANRQMLSRATFVRRRSVCVTLIIWRA
jgi:hypothetical protein